MRGEWIEILRLAQGSDDLFFPSLPMRGEWIEMMAEAEPVDQHKSLSPCGESGLKFRPRVGVDIGAGSLPMRGEWIEIFFMVQSSFGGSVSPHAGRVD